MVLCCGEKDGWATSIRLGWLDLLLSGQACFRSGLDTHLFEIYETKAAVRRLVIELCRVLDVFDMALDLSCRRICSQGNDFIFLELFVNLKINF